MPDATDTTYDTYVDQLLSKTTTFPDFEELASAAGAAVDSAVGPGATGAYEAAANGGLRLLADANGSAVTIDSNSGVVGAAFVDANNNLVVAFEGTRTAAQYALDVALLSNDQQSDPAMGGMADALGFFNKAVTIAANQGIATAYVTGESLGGSQASYVASQTGAPGVGFMTSGVNGYATPAAGFADNYISLVENGDSFANYGTDTAEYASADAGGVTMDHYGHLIELGSAGAATRLAALSRYIAGYAVGQIETGAVVPPGDIATIGEQEWSELFGEYHQLGRYVTDAAGALKAIPQISDVSSTVQTVVGRTLAPISAISIRTNDAPASVTAIVSLADPNLAKFDIGAIANPADVTINDDGSVVFSGSLSNVQADLRSFDLCALASGSDKLSVALTTSTGGSAIASVDAAITLPVSAYTLIGTNVYQISDVTGQTATIDTGSTTPVTVFGGGADFDFTGGQATIVLPSDRAAGRADIVSHGGNVVWAGNGTINYLAGGRSQIVVGSTAGTTSNVNIFGGSANDATEVDILNTTNAAVTTDGSSAVTLFDNTTSLNLTGANTLDVLNGGTGGGTQLITSTTGNNSVWIGEINLLFAEGTGSDDLFMTGTGYNVAIAGSVSSGGSTTISDLGIGSGSLQVDGGAKMQFISIGATNATVFGGIGDQSITASGSGSLTVVDGATKDGLQTINATAATASVDYWGGANRANITLGAGAAFINAATGHISLISGTGSLELELSAASSVKADISGLTSGDVDIYGFTGTNANVTLSISDIINQKQTTGSTIITLTDGHQVNLHGYSGVFTSNGSVF